MKHFGKMEGERSGMIGKATSTLPKESRKSIDLSTGDVFPARDLYSTVQMEWMENPNSDFNKFVEKLKDRMKTTVDGEGKERHRRISTQRLVPRCQTNTTSNRRLEFAFQFDAFMENDFDAAFGDCYSFKKSVDGGGKIYRADQIDDNLWTDYVGG